MNESNFFQEIEHIPVSWRQYQLHVPLFYKDIMFIAISILAPINSIEGILPSKRLKPYRITPWHGVITISAYKYRQCDIAPYNEVSIGALISIDEKIPLFKGIIRRVPKEIMIYSRHLPVTTESAREVGVEIAGYPKFIADIEFTEKGSWIRCGLKADNQTILTLRGRKINLQVCPRNRIHHITYRRGFILRSELIFGESEMGESKNKEDAQLDLGEHQIADELRGLKLGKIIRYRYCPQAQAILTPVIESFSGRRK